MEIKENGVLGKWGNSSAFRIPHKILTYLNFTKEKNYEIRAEITTDGRKRMIIEEIPDTEKKLELLHSMRGVVKESPYQDYDWKDYRKMKAESELKNDKGDY